MATNFEPCIWGNQFLAYDDPAYIPVTANEAVKKEHEELKQQVRWMIVKIQNTPVTSKSMMPLKERLILIDMLDRLGISFHFKDEISDILQRVHLCEDLSSSDDLFIVSTGFRLIRDQGIYVSPTGTFEKFLDQIDESLTKDNIDGLLALYEASDYSIPGEDILDRAQELTGNILRSIMAKLDKGSEQVLFQKIEHVLYRSIRKNCERLVAKFYISIYKQEPIFGESLFKFAVHDYNIRQFSFQKDLATVTKWIEELNMRKTVPLSRHRFVEYYFWALCVFPEPQYSIARIFVTKFIYIFTLVDDMYDTYGTMEEIDLFTNAFAQLDPAFPNLQPHMKAMLVSVNKFYAEVEQQNPGKPYAIKYLKREYERVVRAYEETARWIHSKTIPTYEEYFDVCMITGLRGAFPCTYLVGMGDVASEDVYSWALDDPIPNDLEVTSNITRLQDDLSLSPNEMDKPYMALKVFMKHYGVSEEEAKKIVNQQLRDCWKKKNQGLLKGQSDTLGAPRSFLKAIYGDVRAGDIYNRDGDDYFCQQRFKQFITIIFVEPAVI